MNKNKTNKFFLAIIGLIFVSALLGACGGGNTTSPNRANTGNRNTSAQNPQEIYAKAPAGAVPAHFKGGQNAPVIIEEFADYQCPTCAVLHPTVQQLQAAFGDRVKIVFRNYPLQQIHPKAYDAAVAAEAAGLQGKFWEMQTLLFNNQQAWANASNHRAIFEEYAQRIGLNVDKFKDDMAGMAAKTRVDADVQRGNALRLNSTPSFFINGNPLPPEKLQYESFRQAVEAELAKAQQPRQ
jgi:protein-disulfide isomerase